MKNKKCAAKARPPQAPPDTLEEIKDKWFRPEMVRLLRLEDEIDTDVEFNVDLMPSWGDKHFRQLFREFTDGFGFLDGLPLEFITSEKYGEILGMKSWLAQLIVNTIQQYEAADDATKAKLTKYFGNEFITEMRPTMAEAKKIQAIERKAFSRVRKQNVIERGRFFKGYGRGLLLPEKMMNWVKSAGEKKHKKAYISAYISLNWQEIENAKNHGGWPIILREFQETLPEKVDISEDAFAKALKRAGIGQVGKVGRPKKMKSRR